MQDRETALQSLKDFVRAFNEERDWRQFHDPKNMAEALSIEAGELLERFLWKDVASSKELMHDAAERAEIEDELADVLWYVLMFADETGIDLATAFKNKTDKNAKKYPVEKAKGKATKYDKL